MCKDPWMGIIPLVGSISPIIPYVECSFCICKKHLKKWRINRQPDDVAFLWGFVLTVPLH